MEHQGQSLGLGLGLGLGLSGPEPGRQTSGLDTIRGRVCAHVPVFVCERACVSREYDSRALNKYTLASADADARTHRHGQHSADGLSDALIKAIQMRGCGDT